MTTSARARRRDQRGLARLVLVGDFLGVAAGAGAVLVGRDLDELRAEALDLLLDDLADVEGLDDRAEAARGRDRLQAGDAGAEHEHARRRDRARGGHHHREQLRARVGGEQDGAVAGDARLRAEHVHHLGERRARHQVGGERGDAAAGDVTDALGIGERLEQRDQGASVEQHPALGEARRPHLQDEIGRAEQRAGVRLDARACRLVVGVGDVRGAAGAALHGHLELAGDQSLDGVRRQRDPLLAGQSFFRDANPHGRCPRARLGPASNSATRHEWVERVVGPALHGRAAHPRHCGVFRAYGAVHAWSAGGPAVAEVAGNREFAALWEAL
jgi:hypothetical protein